MGKKQTIENHVWEPLKKHGLTDEGETNYSEAQERTREGELNGIGMMAEILKRIGPNEYLPVHELKAEERNVQPFNNYIEALKYHGLNVDKGNAEYGFKMSLPENGQRYRELIIFRRWKKD